MKLTRIGLLIVASAMMNLCAAFASADDAYPLPAETREKLKKALDAAVDEETKALEKDDKSIRAYSQRGDAYFYLGKFPEAVADYRKMIELDPSLEQTHWRLGLACYYAGEFKPAQRLFELGFEVDKVDRENGIWKYFSQAKAEGIEKAKQELPVYTEFDREPLPSVYKLFSEEITPAQILDEIEKAEISAAEREKRLFYAELYIGMNHALRSEDKPAVEHLRKAVANKWGMRGLGGPNYMWHLARVQYDLLAEKKEEPKK